MAARRKLKACHCFVFVREGTSLWDTFPHKARVLMQMRFDGMLGFPGGLVDADEDLAVALNREFSEETGYKLKDPFTSTDLICSTVFHSEAADIDANLFIKEISHEEFSGILQSSVDAQEAGIEVLGALTFPLYTMTDGVKGLPTFLNNRFAGNARIQLMFSLLWAEIHTSAQLEQVARSSQRVLHSDPRVVEDAEHAIALFDSNR